MDMVLRQGRIPVDDERLHEEQYIVTGGGEKEREIDRNGFNIIPSFDCGMGKKEKSVAGFNF